MHAAQAADGSGGGSSLWIALHGSVYDISGFVAQHPGGERVLRKHAGSDASAAFDRVGHSERATAILAPLRLGPLQTPASAPASVGSTRPPEEAEAVIVGADAAAGAPGEAPPATQVAPSSAGAATNVSDESQPPSESAPEAAALPSAPEAAAALPSPTATRPASGRTPQSRRAPLIGNTLSMNLTNPHQTFLHMARSHGAGMFRVDFGLFRNPMDIVVDPAAGADILQREGADFGKGPGYAAIHSVTPFHLLVTEGEAVAPRRGLIESMLAEAVEKCEARVAAAVASFKPEAGRKVEVSAMLRLLALDVMATLLFGGPLSKQGGAEGEAGPRFVQDLHTTMSEWHHRVTDVVGLWRYMRTPRVRKAEGALARVLAFLDASIAEAKQAAEEQEADAATAGDVPLLRLMVRRGFSDEVVRDTCFTLLAMGHENVATCMSWAVYLLARHPECQTRAREEVQAAAAAAAGGGGVHVEHVEEKLPYVEALLKETVRLYPSIPMLSRRHLRGEDVSVGDHVVPGKVSVDNSETGVAFFSFLRLLGFLGPGGHNVVVLCSIAAATLLPSTASRQPPTPSPLTLLPVCPPSGRNPGVPLHQPPTGGVLAAAGCVQARALPRARRAPAAGHVHSVWHGTTAMPWAALCLSRGEALPRSHFAALHGGACIVQRSQGGPLYLPPAQGHSRCLCGPRVSNARPCWRP